MSITTAESIAPAGGELVASEPDAAPRKSVGERFHQLDGLRAVAVAIVIVHHAFTGPIKHWLHGQGQRYLGDVLYYTTGSGVELFFVLSGVVLLRPYVRGLRPFNAGTYFLRRIERLWPPYLVVLFIEGTVRWITSVHPTWLSAENVYQFNVPDWLKQLPIVNFGSPFWNTAWWSLSVEVLFYLTVPLVLPLFVWRRMNQALLAAIAAGVWLVGFLVLRAVLRDGIEAYSGWTDSIQKLSVYAMCFLIGIAIAKFDWPPRAGWAFVGFGLLYLLLGVRYPEINLHTGYGLMYGGLVMLAFVPGSWLSKTLARPLMVWTGERSYSLFLFHFTAFYAVNYAVSLFLSHKGLAYGVLTRAFGLLLAVFGAMVLFQFVERRFARGLVTADKFWPPLASSK